MTAFPSGGACEVYGDPEDFHGRRRDPIQRAKAICRGCPARLDCLRWALEHHPSGTWGGFTDSERNRYGDKLITRRV